jgi:ribosomal protein S8E
LGAAGKHGSEVKVGARLVYSLLPSHVLLQVTNNPENDGVVNAVLLV